MFQKKIIKVLFTIILFKSYFIFSQKFEKIDTYLSLQKKRNYNSVKELHNFLAKPEYNDEEKVYAFAKYITNNISYGKRANNPLKTIKSNEGVCQDYVELFIALCELSGIENNFVSGDAKNSGSDIGFFNSSHAWNVVKINGEYRLYDLTWASGNYDRENRKFNKKFNKEYFNSNPEVFIQDHFPDKEKWQLLKSPISKENYINQPFFSRNIKNLSLKKGIIRKSNIDITFHSDSIIESCYLYKWKINEFGEQNGINVPISRKGNKYYLKLTENNSGAYTYKLTFYTTRRKNNINNGDNSLITEYILNSSGRIEFKLVTPDYKVPKPNSYDKNNPYDLIKVYHYIFYDLDFAFFKKLNPNNRVKSFDEIPNAFFLHKKLENWFGDYERTIIGLNGKNKIQYSIEGFNIILVKNKNGYEFESLTKKM